ncbi:MAG TPA: KH domain-containing protein [Bacillota bacterium]|nr:KH domain-containing protein [Bacillota bacterium]
MLDLVTFVVKSLVDNPDAVNVTEGRDEIGIVFKVVVATEDIGKVIGKQGRIAKAIRTVVKAANRQDEKVYVEIVS